MAIPGWSLIIGDRDCDLNRVSPRTSLASGASLAARKFKGKSASSHFGRIQSKIDFDGAGEDPTPQVDDEVKTLISSVSKLERGDIREPFLVDAADIECDFDGGFVFGHSCSGVPRQAFGAGCDLSIGMARRGEPPHFIIRDSARFSMNGSILMSKPLI
jgi:hypothetical protein